MMAAGLAPRLERRVGRAVEALARWLALAGGAALTLLAGITILSVAGRAAIPLGLGPVPGDFELVEAGCAFAVFAFLPWCQLRRGHASVDLFVARAGPHARAALALASNLLLSVVAAVIAWQLGLGLADKHAYGEVSLILQMPAWWGYAAGLAGAALFALASLHTAWRSLNELLGAGEPG
jgi:TRAP-type C4-dicarboxylate transport system permease small subunit